MLSSDGETQRRISRALSHSLRYHAYIAAPPKFRALQCMLLFIFVSGRYRAAYRARHAARHVDSVGSPLYQSTFRLCFIPKCLGVPVQFISMSGIHEGR